MASIFNGHGSNDTITWEPEPATRGTFNLLSSCTITLLLCVWSSVHLNLPRNDQGTKQKFLRRLPWIASALVAPDYLIWIAWNQRKMAKMISKEVNETFKGRRRISTQADPESQTLSRQNPWTITHSFWASMGGIAIDPGGSSPFIPDSKCLTLTPSGVLFLLKHEPQLLPDISEAEVKDKSKGGSFTKFVACIQAAWFCLSCIGRLAQKKPISMLELNTFAHAFCTIIVYLIWWRKPLDIEQPLIVRKDRMRRLLAYMWMASKTSCIPEPTSTSNMHIRVGQDPEFEAIVDGNASGADNAIGSGAFNARQRASLIISPAAILANTEDTSMARPMTVCVTTTQDLPGTGFRVNGKSTRWRESIAEGLSERGSVKNLYARYKPAVFNLTPCDVRRWQLAREAMDKYHLRKPNKDLDLVTIKPVPEPMRSNDPDDKPIVWASLGFLLVAAGYGILHALAWNAHFPTHRELKLWRISALIIISPAALLLLLILLGHTIIFTLDILQSCYRKLARNPRPKSAEKSLPQSAVVTDKPSLQRTRNFVETITSKPMSDFIWRYTAIAILWVGSVMYLYIPARIYLVYESIRTVFFLPPEAYSATWTQYLPHIT